MLRSSIVFLIGISLMLLQGCEKREEAPSKWTEEIAGLSWHLDISEAFELAQQQNKKVLVLVQESYCKWCKKMKERTFTDQRIQERFKHYIRVSIKRSNLDALRRVPGFDGNIPSVFFVTPEGKVLDAIVGYFNADDFLGYFHEIEEEF